MARRARPVLGRGRQGLEGPRREEGRAWLLGVALQARGVGRHREPLAASWGCNSKSQHQRETGDCHPAPGEASPHACREGTAQGPQTVETGARNGAREGSGFGLGVHALCQTPHPDSPFAGWLWKCPSTQIQISLDWNSLSQGPPTGNAFRAQALIRGKK